MSKITSAYKFSNKHSNDINLTFVNTPDVYLSFDDICFHRDLQYTSSAECHTNVILFVRHDDLRALTPDEYDLNIHLPEK